MDNRFEGKGIYLLVAATFFFALMGAGVKYVSGSIPVFEIVFFRGLFGTAAIWIIASFRHRKLLGLHKKTLLARGLFGFCAISCYFFAISRLPLADAVLLSYTSPIFVAVLSVLFLHEKVTLQLGMFITVAFVCIYIILKPSFQVFNIGGLAAVGTGFFASFVFIWIKKLKNESPLSIIFYFSFVTTILAGIIMIPVFTRPSFPEFFVLVLNGFLATVAQIFLTIAILVEKVSAATALTCLTVVFSYFLGLIFWGETLDTSSIIAGIVLIISSIIFSKKSLTHKHKAAQ